MSYSGHVCVTTCAEVDVYHRNNQADGSSCPSILAKYTQLNNCCAGSATGPLPPSYDSADHSGGYNSYVHNKPYSEHSSSIFESHGSHYGSHQFATDAEGSSTYDSNNLDEGQLTD